MRILAHMRAADPFRDTNDTDAIRVLIRRGAASYEDEHGLSALDSTPPVNEPSPDPPKARARKTAKRARKR